MASHDTLRIGLIGAGGICRQRHLPGLRAIPGVELAAVCNRSAQSGQAVAAEFGIASVETDWRRLVERDDVDAVVIGTWPYTHAQMSVASLEAGKHVFCQARMAMDLPEAQRMLDAARARSDLVSMLCPPPHRMPWEPYIRDTLRRGAIGGLREVRLMSADGSNLGPLTWRERVELSGQQMLQVGIWAETLHAWVGPYRRLSATLATPIAEKPGDGGEPCRVGIPQVALIHGELESGVPISEHHSGVSTAPPVNTLWLVGSEATLRIEAMGSIAVSRGGGAWAPAEVPEAQQRPWRVERDFVEAVRAARSGGSWSVSPDFAEGLAYMAKVAAVHRAAEAGAAVAPGAL